ncbi:MAG: hypothetical protein AAF191_09730, partial [Verrucomicrobiota bacterium]
MRPPGGLAKGMVFAPVGGADRGAGVIAPGAPGAPGVGGLAKGIVFTPGDGGGAGAEGTAGRGAVGGAGAAVGGGATAGGGGADPGAGGAPSGGDFRVMRTVSRRRGTADVLVRSGCWPRGTGTVEVFGFGGPVGGTGGGSGESSAMSLKNCAR